MMAVPFRHVLIVDDDPIQCEVLLALLVPRLCRQASQAGNGADARTLLASLGQEIDLIITDINMPDCDGVELIGSLHSAGARCPVVILSGASPALLDSIAVLATAYGINLLGTLKKPLRHDELRRMLTTVPS